MTLKVAITQPFFFPYAGYHRLFAAADVFVALDCVQFPRRGWVHRNRLMHRNGGIEWLTLPMVKAPRDTTRICDLRFTADAQHRLTAQFDAFPAIADACAAHPELRRLLLDTSSTPSNYLLRTLLWTTRVLGIERPIISSSSLNVPDSYRARSRLIEICRRIGATHYINAPSGRDLYSQEDFNQANLVLEFLPSYAGSYGSVLERLGAEPPRAIQAELMGNLQALETAAV